MKTVQYTVRTVVWWLRVDVSNGRTVSYHTVEEEAAGEARCEGEKLDVVVIEGEIWNIQSRQKERVVGTVIKLAQIQKCR